MAFQVVHSAVRLRRQLVELQHRFAHAQQIGHHAGSQHLARRGFDGGAIARCDALLVHHRAADADERGAGGQVGRDVGRLHAAGGAERHVREHTAQGTDMRRPAGRRGGEYLHHVGTRGERRTHLGGRERAEHQHGAGGAAGGGERCVHPGRDDEPRAGGEARFGRRRGRAPCRRRPAGPDRMPVRGSAAVASGTVMVISKMRRPASRSHCTAVAACRVACVRTTGTTRAARKRSIGDGGMVSSGAGGRQKPAFA